MLLENDLDCELFYQVNYPSDRFKGVTDLTIPNINPKSI